MTKMGRYCKAFPVTRFREFSDWSENLQNLRKEKRVIDGREVEAPRELHDDDFFYLQENFIVTDGVFIDENIIFDQLTSEWIDFCKNTLAFEVPAYEERSAQPGR
jgi:hypothetical protein